MLRSLRPRLRDKNRRLQEEFDEDPATPAGGQRVSSDPDETPVPMDDNNAAGAERDAHTAWAAGLLDALAKEYAQNVVPLSGYHCYDAHSWFVWLVQQAWMCQELLQRVYLLRRAWGGAELPRSVLFALELLYCSACGYLFDLPPGTDGHPRSTMSEFAVGMGMASNQEQRKGLLLDPQLIRILRSSNGAGAELPMWEGLPALETSWDSEEGRRLISCLGGLTRGAPEIAGTLRAFSTLKRALKDAAKHNVLRKEGIKAMLERLKAQCVERMKLLDSRGYALQFRCGVDGRPLRLLGQLDIITSHARNERGQLLKVLNPIQYRHWVYDQLQREVAEHRARSRRRYHAFVAQTAAAAAAFQATPGPQQQQEADEEEVGADDASVERMLLAAIEQRGLQQLMATAKAVLHSFATDMLHLYVGQLGSSSSRGAHGAGGRHLGSKAYAFATPPEYLVGQLLKHGWDPQACARIAALPSKSQVAALCSGLAFESTLLFVFSKQVLCESADAVAALGRRRAGPLIQFSFQRGYVGSSYLEGFVSCVLRILQSPRWSHCASYWLLKSTLQDARSSQDRAERLMRLRPALTAILICMLPVDSVWLCLPALQSGDARLFCNQRSFWQFPMT